MRKPVPHRPDRRLLKDCVVLLVLACAAMLWGPPATHAQETQVASPVLSQTGKKTQEHAWSGYNGEHLVWLQGNQLQAVDPATGLKRWESQKIKGIRRIIQEEEDKVLFIGQHLLSMSVIDGKKVWDYPLNCFGEGQCNADVMDRIPNRLLLGGFGTRYNMLMLVRSKSGEELWPSWLTTCFFKEAHLAEDAVVVLCDGGNSLLQVVDLETRVTRHSIPSPDPALQPARSWVGAKYTYVYGTIQGDAKLLVMDHTTGKLVKRFNIKAPPDDPDLGFRIVPDAGIFVPTQRKGEQLTLWGLDAATGTVKWSWKEKNLRILTQRGSTLVYEKQSKGQIRIGAVNLETGEPAYTRDLFLQAATAWPLDSGILVVSLPDAAFALLDAITGTARVVGIAPNIALPSSVKTAYINAGLTHTSLLLDNTVMLAENRSADEWLGFLKKALTEQDQEKTASIVARFWPFRWVVAAARKAYTLVVGHRMLAACTQLHRRKVDATISAARQVLKESETWTPEEYRYVIPLLTRVALGLAVQFPQSDRRDDFLFEILDLLVNPRYPSLAPELRLGAALVLARNLNEGMYADVVTDLLAPLSQDPKTAALYADDPMKKLTGIDEVETLLDKIQGAVRSENWDQALEEITSLAEHPTAHILFDDGVEAWLDARSVKLLPKDLLGDRIPGISKGLRKAFAARKRSTYRELNREACESTCSTLEAICPMRCVSASDCYDAGRRCERYCRNGSPKWSFPKPSPAPDSEQFEAQCRPVPRAEGDPQ